MVTLVYFRPARKRAAFRYFNWLTISSSRPGIHCGTQPQLSGFSSGVQQDQPGTQGRQCNGVQSVGDRDQRPFAARGQQEIGNRISKKIKGKNHAMDDDIAAERDGILQQEN